MNSYQEIQELLAREHRLEQELGGLIYGAPEVRDNKYIYTHLRDSGQLLTRYAGEYSDDLYNLILKNNARAKIIKRELKEIRHQLHELGWTKGALEERVKRNIDFAKKNLAITIHSQAILEGVATTFAETEAIIEGGRVQGMTEKDIRKIINMKHAWEFILDDNVVTARDDFVLLSRINQLVNEGFYFNAGKLRDVPVNIGGTDWHPEMPVESKVIEDIDQIMNEDILTVDKAIDLVLFVMRSQIFIDGNKRTAVIFANHFLIQRGAGLLYIPEGKVSEFKNLLIDFYETNKKAAISGFLKQHCVLEI